MKKIVSLIAMLIFSVSVASAQEQACNQAKPGDGFERIAQRCGVSVGELIVANKQAAWFKNDNFVPKGIELSLPSKTNAPSSASDESKQKIADLEKKLEAANARNEQILKNAGNGEAQEKQIAELTKQLAQEKSLRVKAENDLKNLSSKKAQEGKKTEGDNEAALTQERKRANDAEALVAELQKKDAERIAGEWGYQYLILAIPIAFVLGMLLLHLWSTVAKNGFRFSKRQVKKKKSGMVSIKPSEIVPLEDIKGDYQVPPAVSLRKIKIEDARQMSDTQLRVTKDLIIKKIRTLEGRKLFWDTSPILNALTFRNNVRRIDEHRVDLEDSAYALTMAMRERFQPEPEVPRENETILRPKFSIA